MSDFEAAVNRLAHSQGASAADLAPIKDGMLALGEFAATAADHDPETQTRLKEWFRALDTALLLEDVPREWGQRIIERLLYGEPGPHRIRSRASMPDQTATSFLYVWLDQALRAPEAGPRFCPQCRGEMSAVTVGRGAPAWFKVDPCGCLFEVVGKLREHREATGAADA